MSETEAKREVLDRIRTALGPSPSIEPVTRGYRTAGDHPPGSPALLDLLVDRLEDYRAIVARATPAAIADAVADALRDVTGADRPSVAVPQGLPQAWLAAGLDVVVDDGLPADRLDEVDAVVTGAALAIAETGTIVLDGSPDQGRRAISLVPDLHVCVVHAETVVGTVPEALARLEATRPQTWISGPSATSDIELERVEGVHGPRTLHVVLVT